MIFWKLAFIHTALPMDLLVIGLVAIQMGGTIDQECKVEISNVTDEIQSNERDPPVLTEPHRVDVSGQNEAHDEANPDVKPVNQIETITFDSGRNR